MKRESLNGHLDSLAGQAPEQAWEAVGGEMRRPADLWMVGHPPDLLSNPGDWKRKLRQRWIAPVGPLGMRLRFVVDNAAHLDLDLLAMVATVLETLPETSEELFLHAELMTGPEEGMYLAYDNRAPALLTQAWLAHADQPPVGEIPSLSAPLHVNIVLHDPNTGFREIWNDGTLDYALERLRGMSLALVRPGEVHGFTLARGDGRSHGISLGLETLHQEQGADGGPAAADHDGAKPGDHPSTPVVGRYTS